MPAKMGINGFGRIGRLVFRAAMANPGVEVHFCSGFKINPFLGDGVTSQSRCAGARDLLLPPLKRQTRPHKPSRPS